MDFTYKTLEGPAEAAIKERGSSFLGFAYPVQTPEEVKTLVRDLKKLHPKANHHCFAYRLGTEGLQFRASDDGEPSGSAGRPILGQIDSAGLTNLLIVVVRYFGGTLLGVPGLIQAYKCTAAASIAAGTVIEKHIETVVRIRFGYPALSEVLQLLRQHEVHIYEQDMGLFCDFRAGVPLRHKERLFESLIKIRDLRIEPVL